jgi:thiol-disulfide isomerase/thioredoxin
VEKLLEMLAAFGSNWLVSEEDCHCRFTGLCWAAMQRLLNVIVFALASVATSVAVSAAETSYPSLPLGSTAPDFKLPGVDGKMWSLSDFKDARILTVIFTCNHCPTAQYYEERIKRLVNDYRAKGVAFVAISPNDATNGVRPDELGYTDLSDSLDEMKIRAEHKQFNFPYLFGGGDLEAASRAYGPVATPHAFIFDASRKLRYSGRIDDSEREQFVRVQDVRNVLDALLADKEPPVTQTKVFGCSTKWASKAGGLSNYWARIKAEPVAVEPVNEDGLRSLRMNDSGKNDKAKLRLVSFWATWCGPCITEFPDLMMINRMYRQRDFELVTVAAQFPDEKEEVLKFLQKHHASNKNLIFGGTDKYKLIEAFDPKWNGSLPYTLLIDPAGEILYRKEGPFDALELKRTIVKTLNARKPW